MYEGNWYYWQEKVIFFLILGYDENQGVCAWGGEDLVNEWSIMVCSVGWEWEVESEEEGLESNLVVVLVVVRFRVVSYMEGDNL